MKKRILFVLLLLVAASIWVAVAEESLFYTKTVPIVKVYSHKLGYKVIYLKNDMNLGEFYVPFKWLQEPGGKGEVVYGEGKAFPYFSVFYKEGKFDHIRLYLESDRTAESWGTLNPKQDVNEKFNIDTLTLEF